MARRITGRQLTIACGAIHPSIWERCTAISMASMRQAKAQSRRWALVPTVGGFGCAWQAPRRVWGSVACVLLQSPELSWGHARCLVGGGAGKKAGALTVVAAAGTTCVWSGQVARQPRRGHCCWRRHRSGFGSVALGGPGVGLFAARARTRPADARTPGRRNGRSRRPAWLCADAGDARTAF